MTRAAVLGSPIAHSLSPVVVSGFDLLLHQAARQVELMTGIKPAPWTRCAPPATPN